MYQAMIIDDDQDYRNLLIRKLSRSFPNIVISEIDPLTMPLPGEKHSWDDIDFIILDYQLGVEETGLDWFKRFEPHQMPATILLTGRGSEEIAVRAIKLGIDDYIVKENFNDDELIVSINDCVYNKKLGRARLKELDHKSKVFNKSDFIHRLGKITLDKDTGCHLLMFNPDSYRQIGKERGLALQDHYINHIANAIYHYLASNHIDSNIYIYKEEYIAVIIKKKSYKRFLNQIYKILGNNSFNIGTTHYPCSATVGVISPNSLEVSHINKSDFELLSIAKHLCTSAKTSKKTRICIYGDVNLNDVGYPFDGPLQMQKAEPLDIKQVISDGRASASYQSWIYISTDETINLRAIYDVRLEVIDIEGNIIPQNKLVKLLEDPFVKRGVDRWVLRNSVTHLKVLSDTNSKMGNIKLSVKLTLATVSDSGFIPWLHELLKDADLPRNCLMLEFDSTQFLRNPVNHKKVIEEFGNPYLIKFILSGVDQIDTYYKVRDLQKFEYVKLNVKDLIYGFPRNPLLRLIDNIKEYKAKIVAINVDDAETLNLATDFDIDYVQGDLVGKPQIDVIADSEGDLYCVV